MKTNQIITAFAVVALLGAGVLVQAEETNQPAWMKPDPAAMKKWQDLRSACSSAGDR